MLLKYINFGMFCDSLLYTHAISFFHKNDELIFSTFQKSRFSVYLRNLYVFLLSKVMS